MEAYPIDYIDHNLPLVFLSGLGPTSDLQNLTESSPAILQENGIQIHSDFPVLDGTSAVGLLKTLLEEDATRASWNARNFKAGGIGFRVQRVGRVG